MVTSDGCRASIYTNCPIQTSRPTRTPRTRCSQGRKLPPPGQHKRKLLQDLAKQRHEHRNQTSASCKLNTNYLRSLKPLFRMEHQPVCLLLGTVCKKISGKEVGHFASHALTGGMTSEPKRSALVLEGGRELTCGVPYCWFSSPRLPPRPPRPPRPTPSPGRGSARATSSAPSPRCPPTTATRNWRPFTR